MTHSVLKCSRGTTMVETALTFVLLLALTFGIFEFSHVFWQWNSAEKATRLGARLAVTANPVAEELKTFDCATGTVLAGTNCSHPDAQTFGTIVCDGASSSCTGGYTFSATA